MQVFALRDLEREGFLDQGYDASKRSSSSAGCSDRGGSDPVDRVVDRNAVIARDLAGAWRADLERRAGLDTVDEADAFLFGKNIVNELDRGMGWTPARFGIRIDALRTVHGCLQKRGEVYGIVVIEPYLSQGCQFDNAQLRAVSLMQAIGREHRACRVACDRLAQAGGRLQGVVVCGVALMSGKQSAALRRSCARASALSTGTAVRTASLEEQQERLPREVVVGEESLRLPSIAGRSAGLARQAAAHAPRSAGMLCRKSVGGRPWRTSKVDTGGSREPRVAQPLPQHARRSDVRGVQRMR